MLSFGRYVHPRSPELTIVGHRLGEGAIIQPGDFFDHSSGNWEKALWTSFILDENLPRILLGEAYQPAAPMSTFTKDPKEHELHHHPMDPRQLVWGTRLLPGDTVQTGDYFAAQTGKWQEFTSLGHTIEPNNNTYWVRMH